MAIHATITIRVAYDTTTLTKEEIHDTLYTSIERSITRGAINPSDLVSEEHETEIEVNTEARS